MSSYAFTLILFSALMHALWNLLVKRSGDKTVFIWWMFATSCSLMTLALPLVGPFPALSWPTQDVIITFMSSLRRAFLRIDLLLERILHVHLYLVATYSEVYPNLWCFTVLQHAS